jgi:hypothetical protein
VKSPLSVLQDISTSVPTHDVGSNEMAGNRDMATVLRLQFQKSSKFRSKISQDLLI